MVFPDNAPEISFRDSEPPKFLKLASHEEKENYAILERKVDFEEARNDNLCKVVHTSNEQNEKHVGSLKKANDICKELASDMSKLVELNTSLSKDAELLTMSLKTKDDELTILKKSLEAHKLAHINTLTKITHLLL